MGEMLESIAHQWRQPLNIIGLSCANLETEYELGLMDTKNFKEKMQIISTNINYMSETIDDFRHFLSPDRKLSYFNPTKTIEDVLQILQAQLTNNNITITINTLKKIELYGIENEFKQVIFVLINNAKDAIKSSIQDKIISYGEIIITIKEENSYNEISFCDNGGGIKDEIINSIFDPYFSTKFASCGTGIGLYIAKNIIESRMNGNLNVNNTKDGCCFHIKQMVKKQ
jgi:signal transduction histidine kinase